jgi:hypothetical protein
MQLLIAMGKQHLAAGAVFHVMHTGCAAALPIPAPTCKQPHQLCTHSHAAARILCRAAAYRLPCTFGGAAVVSVADKAAIDAF